MHERALSLLAGCGLFQAGMGLYFIALRPAMLVEDERFTGASLEAITLVAPSISMWLDRVFIVLGGHAVTAGLLIVLVAIQSWRRTVSLVALILIASAGGMSVVLMSAVNFAINSDFRWLLLLPALAWTGAVLLLGREWMGARGRDPQGSTDLQATGGRNDETLPGSHGRGRNDDKRRVRAGN